METMLSSTKGYLVLYMFKSNKQYLVCVIRKILVGFLLAVVWMFIAL